MKIGWIFLSLEYLKFFIMKRLLVLLLMFLFISCGTMNNSKITSSTDKNEIVLPPNTNSNKYSKKRQN